MEQNFNPRSHKGSDYLRISGKGRDKNFNPRSHKGSDKAGDYIIRGVNGISIHAPTRGATMAQGVGVGFEKFQSTLPQGERHGLPPV